MVDDVAISQYDSKRSTLDIKQKWIETNLGEDYQKEQTDILKGAQANFKVNIGTLMQRFNQTSGIHTWQLMYGCELDDDGTTRGFNQYGYDGNDYVSFDKQTLTWTAANQRGQTTKVRWDPDTAYNQQWKGYLEGTCIEWLKKYVTYGAKTLERQVRPEVYLTYKETETGTEATCHVTGFLPRDIEVMWQDGGSRDLDVESGEVLPNEDGTYQVKKTLKLRVNKDKLKKGDYSCHVAHSSLTGNQEIRIPFDPAMKNPNGAQNPKYTQAQSGENSSTGSSNEA
uniref:Major histocompatibility complex class I-related gene protein-like n=1 Tax=Erpetoichthys calabaricus TaxID=27687 RepID=A0A8C4TGE0_ERPCA